MKRFIAGLIAGLAAGAAGGYFAARKKFKAELKDALDKAEVRYQHLRGVDHSEAEMEKRKAIEEAKIEAIKTVLAEDAHINDGVDLDALCREEEEEARGSGLIVEHPGSEFYDEEQDWDDYLESVSEYVGSAVPYNITEEMFSETHQHYEKRKLYLCVDEGEDYAYDADTGDIVDGYHDLIGDESHNTLDPEREMGGAWYVRNDMEATDFMIQYQNSALLR